jgi:hypothetical protein
MKAIILVLLFSLNANAGTAKLSWTHDNKAEDGSIVVLTAFKVYWGVNGAPNNAVIPLGPPALLPWKVVAGMYHYAKTLNDASWVPGATVCFQMTALAGALESDRSGQVCKLMPSDPNAPVIVDVDTP